MSHNQDRLVIAISSRALFDLSESHQIFTEQGTQAYHQYQIKHENEVLKPGVAFSLTQKLLALNSTENRHVEVILLSRNSAETGLRVFNSIRHYNLDIARAAFTRGAPTSRYVAAFGAHLFLSADAEDVRRVLDDGYAAATIFPGAGQSALAEDGHQLRIAFDGDAVLFSDESERVYQKQGLDAFTAHEQANAHAPLSGGPFKNFLAALHRIQSSYPEDKLPLRTALLTARAAPAHERVVRTLREWDIRIDEAFFLGGLDKSEFLRMFGADIFFDDQMKHCESASRHVATGHVPHGVINEIKPLDEISLILPVAPAKTQDVVAEKEDVFAEPLPQEAMPAIITPEPEFKHPTHAFMDDPLLTLAPMPQAEELSFKEPFIEEQPFEQPHHEIALSPLDVPNQAAHLVVDGAAPAPSISSTQMPDSNENVWLFDEDPSGINPGAPTHQPLPTPQTTPVAASAPTPAATASSAPSPSAAAIAARLNAQKSTPEPEASALSTEEILRRFARKMTEGMQTPQAAIASTSQNTAATPVSDPLLHTHNDVFQENNTFQEIEEISYDAVLDPTPSPKPSAALKPASAPVDNKNNNAADNSAARPSVPNPFALMKDSDK